LGILMTIIFIVIGILRYFHIIWFPFPEASSLRCTMNMTDYFFYKTPDQNVNLLYCSLVITR
jgi:hypothetical protein